MDSLYKTEVSKIHVSCEGRCFALILRRSVLTTVLKMHLLFLKSTRRTSEEKETVFSCVSHPASPAFVGD